MDFRTMVLSAGLALAATTALATPQYSGTTSGDGSLGAGAGYYLWNDASAPNQWSLRWTAPGADHDPVDWLGSIVFQDSNLGETDSYLFESSGIHADSMNRLDNSAWFSGGDAFNWTAATNNSGGVDGIDFTLTGDMELMEIHLGSSLFDDLGLTLGDPGQTSEGIYIGGDYSATNVLAYENGGMIYQSFEVLVPEPGTLALLGLGIVALGLARRREAKAA